MDAWNEWLDSPVDVTALGDRGLEPLPKTVGQADPSSPPQDGRTGRTITPSTPAETVHELRKDAKKLRYLIECFGGLYDKSARTAFVGRLKALQDTLGEHQDAEVHAHALRTIADDRRQAVERRHAAGDRTARRAPRAAASWPAGTSSPTASAPSTRRTTAKALKDLLASAGRAS